MEDTYGVIVYQEQIMMIASRMAGFSLGEADLLRRAVSKKKKEILDRERSHFVEGCLKKEYSVDTANEVYDLIVKFANYGFNRSHAVAYSMIGCQLAYLKAHYPLYFMCGLLTSVIGNEDKISQYLYEAKGSGIRILPPSVNKSSFPFTVENGSVRYSLRAIKSVGVSAVKDIYKARKEKPFEDLFDFCFRVPSKSVNRKMLEALIFSGAMDEFGTKTEYCCSHPLMLLWNMLSYSAADDDQMGLFLDESFSIKPKYVETEELPLVDLLAFEKETLGIYFSNHPLSAFRKQLTAQGAVSILQAQRAVKRRLSLGVLLSKIKTIRTKTGQNMAFLTLSDETGEMEAVVFPEQFRQLSPVLREGALLFTAGKCEVRQDKIQFIMSRAELLENMDADKAPSVYIKIESSQHSQEILAKIKRILLEHKGETGVYLYYERQKQTIKLPESFHINADHQVLYRLKELLGQKNVVLKQW
nr:OB-fold nucleic acid binding domain-containing protein [Bacillus subtilis]